MRTRGGSSILQPLSRSCWVTYVARSPYTAQQQYIAHAVPANNPRTQTARPVAPPAGSWAARRPERVRALPTGDPAGHGGWTSKSDPSAPRPVLTPSPGRPRRAARAWQVARAHPPDNEDPQQCPKWTTIDSRPTATTTMIQTEPRGEALVSTHRHGPRPDSTSTMEHHRSTALPHDGRLRQDVGKNQGRDRRFRWSRP